MISIIHSGGAFPLSLPDILPEAEIASGASSQVTVRSGCSCAPAPLFTTTTYRLDHASEPDTSIGLSVTTTGASQQVAETLSTLVSISGDLLYVTFSEWNTSTGRAAINGAEVEVSGPADLQTLFSDGISYKALLNADNTVVADTTMGSVVFRGGAGKDILHGASGDDQLTAGSENDRLFGHRGDDTLSGKTGRDTLRGGKGNDTLIGGRGGDKLLGGNGDDRLDGGKGSDKLAGGNGADIFVFTTAGAHRDRILDFTDGVDLFDVGAAIMGPEDFEVIASGADVEIRAGEAVFVVLDTTAGAISADDFV